MANTTKSRILDAALVMFAENGYKGTNLRDLAASLGLSKPALYRHYESKEAIWNAVLDRMEAYYNERFGSDRNPPPLPGSAAELEELTIRMLSFTLNDDQIRLCRKLLTTEQFHDERAAALASNHFLTGLTALFEKLFTGMMAEGTLHQGDPRMTAFAFTAPISALVHESDRRPDRKPELLEEVRAFVRHFAAVYGVQE